jgi:hypothetical protein
LPRFITVTPAGTTTAGLKPIGPSLLSDIL